MAKKSPRFRWGTRLRIWRQFRGLSQEQAAGKLGWDRSTLSKIERGLVPYDQEFLEAAAILYGCIPEDLLSRDPNDTTSEVIDTFRSLSEDKQKQIAAIVATFKSR